MNNGSTLVGTVTDRLSTSFLDAFGFHGDEDTLRPNTDYYYRVYVYDRGGLSAGGNIQLVHSPAYSAAPALPAARKPAAAPTGTPR